MVKVKIFTTSSCPWCVKAKDYFTKKKIPYDEVNVGEDEAGRNEMIEKSGQMGVPVIQIEADGKEPVLIVGFDKDAIEEAIA